jgi:hypothetical protein
MECEHIHWQEGRCWNVPANVVLKLESLLGCRKKTLTNIHLDYDTHLFGRLHSKKKMNPNAVVAAKLKKGDLVAMGNSRGNMVLEWHDEKDVTFLSTCH